MDSARVRNSASLSRSASSACRRSGDVLEGALKTQDLPVGVAYRLADGPHPDAPARRRDLRHLEVIRRAVAFAGRHMPADVGAMLGRVVVNAFVERRLVTGRQIVNGAGFVRPGERAAGQLNRPPAEARDPAGDAQQRDRLGRHLAVVFTLTDIDEHVDRAGRSARGIGKRVDLRQHGDAGAVRPLDGDLLAANRLAGGEHASHAAVLVRNHRSIGRKKLDRTAEPFGHVVQSRLAPPQPRGGLIEVGNASFGVARIGAHREQIHHAAELRLDAAHRVFRPLALDVRRISRHCRSI